MRIAIYGGSFDPIHSGHAIIANFVSQCGLVDEVWLMVSRKNPLKENSTFASDDQRLEMAEMITSDCRNVKVSDFEIHLPIPSYTYNTLTELKKKYPDNEFVLLIGSDNFTVFDKWKNSQEIQKEFGLIVYPRPGYPLPEAEPENVTFLCGAPEIVISSSLIREYVRDGWNINYFVPINVARYIQEKKLYKVKE